MTDLLYCLLYDGYVILLTIWRICHTTYYMTYTLFAGELEDEDDDIDEDGQQYLEKLEKSVSKRIEVLNCLIL